MVKSETLDTGSEHRSQIRHSRQAEVPGCVPLHLSRMLVDRVFQSWKDVGLLVNYPNVKYIMLTFLIPKRTPLSGNGVRSHPGATWWKSTLSAVSSFTSCFEITMAYATLARKCLMQFLIVHSLAPSIFQRFAMVCLEEVLLATKVVACLEDWLLFDRDPRAHLGAVDLILFYCCFCMIVNFVLWLEELVKESWI